MMGIFQKSVINKHLANLDSGQVETAYQKFRDNYNSAKIEEIKNLKEEEYQDGFLRDIFVDVLGFVLAPNENHNLAREFKNISDSKKADGAILKDGKAVAVVELKSTNTKDLKSVTDQAFGYKHNQPGCKYVIISNFQKLQFYIDYANEYEEFDLFNLQRDEFELLYLLLNSESIFSDLPLKLKTETKFHEENVSNKLYKDYSIFKKKLFENLIKNNPENDKLTLFKKSQKLLDRFLFILFAEDSGLLPPNSITRIIDKYNLLIELDEYKAVYEIYKQYFGYMNIGRKGKTEADKIPAYNGGLFYPDELLDNLIIDDEILISDLLKLSEYDFNTEVDVNILGHIFEHSLNEIEEITAEIEGTATDKKKSKRKKDGVFYTPKYITQYIVENTVGTLCKEKRKEFEISEIEFDGTYKTKDGKLSVKGKKLFETLEKYKEWLLTLKIVDPACGSGAFLNQALNFLIAEHKSLDDIIAELTNTPLRLYDTEKSILENNLYGVDINEESVEIAKLSLWLRTARKDRKLSNLNSNIKCGNSLIDDPEVAGDKAFNWHEEFSEIMQNGGFDVVIGNPPYVNFVNLPLLQRDYFKRYSKVFKNKTDLYAFFIEKSTSLLKQNGYFSFIFPHTWVSTTSFAPLRNWIFDHFRISHLVELEFGVFNDAIVKTVILVCERSSKFDGVPIYNDKFDFTVKIPKNSIFKDEFKVIGFDWTPQKQNLEDKLFSNSTRLENILKFTRGIKTSNDNRFLSFEKKNDKYKKVIRGRNIKSYRIDYNKEYIWYMPDLMREKVGCLPHTKELFEVKEKLITQRVNSSGKLLVTYDNEQYYALDTTNVSTILKTTNIRLKYLLATLNSKLINWWFNDKFRMPTISGYELHQIPIKEITKKLQQPFIDNADKMLELNKQFQQKKNEFLSRVKDNFEIEKTTKKLDAFYNFDFKTFVTEVKKQKVTISLTEQVEWEEFFNNYKTELNNLQSEINKTDKEIDQMVYELYGLTAEEIKIVEGR